jgi:hypothetical protein
MKHHLIAMPIALIISLVPANLVQAEREIIFTQGKNSTIIKDRVGMYNKTYSFRAKKGQRLRLELLSKPDLVFTVYYYCGEEYGIPLSDRARQYTGKLPCTDRYTFDVHRVNEAPAKAVPIDFSLKMKIENRS